MYARVTEFDGERTEEVERDIAYFDSEIRPEAERLPGLAGLLYLVDRGSSRTLVITLWESQENLEESRTVTDTLQSLVSQAMDLRRPPSVHEYDVALAQLDAPTFGQ